MPLLVLIPSIQTRTRVNLTFALPWKGFSTDAWSAPVSLIPEMMETHRAADVGASWVSGATESPVAGSNSKSALLLRFSCLKISG